MHTSSTLCSCEQTLRIAFAPPVFGGRTWLMAGGLVKARLRALMPSTMMNDWQSVSASAWRRRVRHASGAMGLASSSASNKAASAVAESRENESSK
eukprot:6068257-Prymnesium_polylepis.1